MSWGVEFTDEFGNWYAGLSASVQDDVDRIVGLLEARGPQLPFPYSSGIASSRHSHLRELRIQSGGEPFRVFNAFNPRRTAVLLTGGNKAGDSRFHETMVEAADQLYDVHMAELKKEGLL
jgi:hypothetical protein